MEMKKRITSWSVLLVCSLFLVFSGTAQAADFKDLLDQHPTKAIDYVVEKGIFKGYSDQTFRPDRAVSRAELITVLLRMAYPEQDFSGCKQPKPFKDLSSNHWAYPSLCKGVQVGILSGYSDGRIKPEQSISLAEASKMIVLALGIKPSEGTENWYQPFVSALSERSAIPDSVYSFEKALSRAELAQIIYRLKAKPKGLESMSYLSLRPAFIEPISDTQSRIHVNGKAYTTGIEFEQSDQGCMMKKAVVGGVTLLGINNQPVPCLDSLKKDLFRAWANDRQLEIVFLGKKVVIPYKVPNFSLPGTLKKVVELINFSSSGIPDLKTVSEEYQGKKLTQLQLSPEGTVLAFGVPVGKTVPVYLIEPTGELQVLEESYPMSSCENKKTALRLPYLDRLHQRLIYSETCPENESPQKTVRLYSQKRKDWIMTISRFNDPAEIEVRTKLINYSITLEEQSSGCVGLPTAPEKACPFRIVTGMNLGNASLFRFSQPLVSPSRFGYSDFQLDYDLNTSQDELAVFIPGQGVTAYLSLSHFPDLLSQQQLALNPEQKLMKQSYFNSFVVNLPPAWDILTRDELMNLSSIRSRQISKPEAPITLVSPELFKNPIQSDKLIWMKLRPIQNSDQSREKLVYQYLPTLMKLEEVPSFQLERRVRLKKTFYHVIWENPDDGTETFLLVPFQKGYFLLQSNKLLEDTEWILDTLP